MKHKICYCADRPECHECGIPCYVDDPEKIKIWIAKMEEKECED